MTDTRKIRWGMLGTKEILSDAIAKAIQASDTSTLVAIGSRDLNKAIAFSKKHNVPTYYANYQELLSDKDIDSVYIGLPNSLHKEWIIRCAKAGKHILCEKPFVLDTQEAEEVFAVVKKHNVFCMEALMYRCHPFIEQLQHLIDSNVLGRIKDITAKYNCKIDTLANPIEGGAIRCLGCYPGSLVRLLAKEEPVGISATGTIDRTGNDSNSVVMLTFKSGMIATISTDYTMEWYSHFLILGTNGILDVKANPWFPGDTNRVILKINGKEEEILDFKVDNPKPFYTYQIDCVAEHIKKGLISPESPGVTWEHSIGNVTVLETWLAQVKGKTNELHEINSNNSRQNQRFNQMF